ncbi:MAG: flavocytochrome c [Bacillota bacterium]
MKRSLVMVMALGLLLALVAGCGPKVQADARKTTDVVIIGGGGAGLTAAVEAASLGAKVILLEKRAALGGTTMMAGGGLDAGGSKWQKAAGVDYTAAKYLEDVKKYGNSKGIPELTKLLADQSAAALEWLEKQGFKFKLSNPALFPSRHTAEAGSPGVETVKALQAAATKAGVEILLETEATELVVDSKGTTLGVKAKQKDGKTLYVRGKATIIATGGYGANAAMLKELSPAWTDLQTNVVAPGSTGDGIKMAKAVGADLTHLEYVQAYHTVTTRGTVARGVEAGGAIFINSEGKRFVNELADNITASKAVLAQPGKKAFLVFGKGQQEAQAKNIETWKGQGILVEGKDAAELASKLGVPGANLTATLKAFNAAVKAGADAEFGRPRFGPALEGPFFALEIKPGVYATLGGIKINASGQVLKGGQPVSRLFAAGECVGGIFGENKFLVSTATANIVFGRVAAQNAVKSFKK